MARARRRCGAALGASIASLVATHARPAEPVASPPRVEVALVGSARDDPTLFGRIQSLCDPGTDVELETRERLDSGAVLDPRETGTVYLWITRGEGTGARVYVAMREAGASRTRYLFREVSLDSGLDEVGSETLAQIAHSSAQALWTRDRQTSKRELVAELERDSESAPENRTEPLASPAPFATRVAPVSRPNPTAESQESDYGQSSATAVVSPTLEWLLGATYAMHASGVEGWLHEPGAFAALIYDERLSMWLAASYLLPKEFDVPPARVRLTGVFSELRIGWICGIAGRARFRLEAGTGILLGQWSAEIPLTEPRASAEPSEDAQRGYALAATAIELPLGPLRLGLRTELRVPFHKTTYEVAGGDESVTNTWLNPGAALEIGIPLSRSNAESRQ